MKREFMKRFNKFTSLLTATVLLLCSFDGINVRAAYEVAVENAAVSDVSAVSDNYAAPQPQPAPRPEDTEENAENYDTNSYVIDNVSEGYLAAADDSVSEDAALPENSNEEELISAYSLAGGISAYSAYTVTAADLDYYYNNPDAMYYSINNVDDWLKVDALSKVVDFEGRTINVQTPDDDSLGGKYYLEGTGFTGLGSETVPFKGTLQTSLSGTSVNCDCPLVSYMSSKATIERFVLGMSGGNAGIAGTLIFEGDEDTTMLLKGITVTGYLEDNVSDGVGGLFGAVINTTEHRFTIDAATVSQSGVDNWGGINMTFEEHDGKAALIGKNVGTFVGKIVGNVELIVNEDFHINAPLQGGSTGKLPKLYGTEATGSIVGRMEYYQTPLTSVMGQSQLSNMVGYAANPDLYPMIHFKQWSGFSVDNISGEGYNGGIAGYCDHAKIFNDTENSVLEISNSTVSGGKAAGGFIGYAAYTTIDGTGMGEIKINNSTFECSIATYIRDGINEGIVGGFIGIYGDGNNLFNGIKITVDNLVFTTITSTDANLTRYMGGLIGKYASKDDIIITPESEMVSISNIDFKVYATNTYCGGFISYVPAESGSLNLDTSLYIENIRLYLPSDRTNQYVYTSAFGGIASIVDSDNLTVKNITIKGLAATMGRYLGCVAGMVRGEDSVFENLVLSDMAISDNMDGKSQTPYYSYKNTNGAGTIAGYHKRSAKIKGITVTGLSLSPYIYSYINDDLKYTQSGIGGLIGVLGDSALQYTITDISDVSVSGEFDIRYYSNYRTYAAGLIGYVYPKTAVCLDGVINLSGITSFKSGQVRYRGKLIGYQREALIYMEPTCNAVYNDEVFATIDELGNYGGIYRNESFWDDALITEGSVSVEGDACIIEKDSASVSGIRINGSVAAYDGGWGLSTMGDYMRLTIVNNTIGYYGLECFGSAADYDSIAGGRFTALNDIDLSKRYMGVLTLNRNDNPDYANANFNYAKYQFHGVFKGMDGEKTKIILPGVTVYNQANAGGLFSVVVGAEFRNLCISGTLNASKASAGSVNLNSAGALAAIAGNRVVVEDVDIENLTLNTYVGDSNMSAGSLFGYCRYYMRYSGNGIIENVDYVTESVDKYGNITPTRHWDSSIKNVTVKNCTINGVNNNNNSFLGGLAGRWYYESDSTSQTVDFNNVNLINTDITDQYTGEGKIGGLFANTSSYEDFKLTFNFNDVKIDGMDITSASNGSLGGFWGYNWVQTDVNLTFTNNTDKVIVDNSTINGTSTGVNTKFGGMIYEYMYSRFSAENGLVIQNTHISVPKSTQNECSFFISQAKTLLLMLRDYRLINTSVEFNGKQFDEIAGTTKNAGDISQQLNMGIVSLSDSENPFCLQKVDEDGNTFHVYEYQSDYTKCPNLEKPYYNAYTRYYYNLDEVAAEVAKDPITVTKINYNDMEREAYDIRTPEQLLMWHILMTIHTNTYYYQSRSVHMMNYFKECFNVEKFDINYVASMRNKQLKITGKLDMSGLSFYPTAITANTSVGSERMVVGADFDTEDAGEGNNGIIFNYDEINLETQKRLAQMQTNNCVVLRSVCTTGSYGRASQHSLMQCSLFGCDSSINLMSDISFGGSIGAVRYNNETLNGATTYPWYSGAAFCGVLQSTNTETRFENITFDGLFVVNPGEDYLNDAAGGSLENWQNYYGMLMGGWTSNQNSMFFDKIETRNYGDFLAKYPNKKAASALIGRVGTWSLSQLKKFEFSNMSIADAEETNVLTANGATLDKIHATAEDQIMAYASYVYSYQYLQAEQGFYNFDDVCYFYGNNQFTNQPSGDKYYITLGKELGTDAGVTKTEYYNTSSKVGTPSYDTVKAAENSDYQDFKESTANNYWLKDFSNLNYKPYIYNYAERYINVNYKSGDLLEGCGTYEDPYIISNERQLYSLYCYLAAGGLRYVAGYNYDVNDNASYGSNTLRYPQYNNGFKTKLNEWKVNIPGNDDHMCDGHHEFLTYDYEQNPVSGFEDTLKETKNGNTVTTARYIKWDRDARITVNLLRNAYYKITADIDMSEYEDFYGLCHFDPKLENYPDSSKYFPFTGVIIGEKPDGSAPVIKMPHFKKFSGNNQNMIDYMRSYGFVASAKGCVLKNLDIKYPEDGFAKAGYYYSSWGQYNFGGAIGNIWGGDNIIDNVRVEGSIMINQTSVSSGITNRSYMGGLVGGIYGGGLILRNLSTDDFSDFDFKLATSTSNVLAPCNPNLSYTAELNRVGADYDYINGVAGRVLDAYILVESVDEPRNGTNADGIEQKRLDDTGAVIDFTDYDATNPKKLHAQNSYNLINGKYLADAGKIKITRNGYNFETEVLNAKQLFAYAQTMNSGGFFTVGGSTVNSNTGYANYGSEMYHSKNNLNHVYHCGASAISYSYDGSAPYDVYSRCRKAKYDMVGKCDVSDEASSVNEDYRYAKKYDNILTEEYFKTELSEFDSNSYKNYLGYNYMVANYFDFYEGSSKDEFWIMRRSGIFNNINADGSNNQSRNQCNKMHNIYNVYGGRENIMYQGRTSLTLANGTYDMTPFKKSFRGLGSMYASSPTESSASGGYGNSSIFNGSFYGNNSTVKLDMNCDSGSNYAGLFTRLLPGFENNSNYQNKENDPLYEIKDLTITGRVDNLQTTYRSNGQRAGMLCAYINNGRYKISNIHTENAEMGAYEYVGGIIGAIDSNTQLIMDNCTAQGLELTNAPEGAKNFTNCQLGGIFGRLSTYGNNYGNNAYITNCSVSDIHCSSPNTATIYFGGFSGWGSLYNLDMYDNSTDNISSDLKSQYAYVGGLMGYVSEGRDVDIANTELKRLRVSAPALNANTIYTGGAFGYLVSITNIFMKNTHVSNIRTDIGAVNKPTTAYYFTNAPNNSVGGLIGTSYRIGLHLDGVFIEDVKPEESKLTISDMTESNGVYTRVNATSTQQVKYSGGLIGYMYTQNYYQNEYTVKLVSLKDDDRLTPASTPAPTPKVQYQSGSVAYDIPAMPENTNKGKRNYIRDSEFIAQYSGGLIGYVNNDCAYNVNTQNKTDWLIEDTDITENKIIAQYSYKDGNYAASNRYNSGYYVQTAGGMFGYLYRSFRSDIYSSGINIEHNVIGTMQNAPSKACSGGMYGYVAEGENTTIDRSGFSNYHYNTTLKNNYIGPLALIENEAQYYQTANQQLTYNFIKELSEGYNKLRTMSIDELGAYTRLYVNGEMADQKSWDYSVTEPGTGEWYAQDNLYKYAKNVGMFIGLNSQTANTNKRFHIFIVEPNIIYDGTVYKSGSGADAVSKIADAHRPAVDVGSATALGAEDDMYAYREYTHIVYNDANAPTEYGAWNENVANDVVPNGLNYSDNHDYLFAQLRNIYDDYKDQINGNIADAQYDETAHTYRLKDNYGQIENGYTMDEVYDYVYYGYERDADGNPISETPDYLSPYTDKDGKVIPMLVYKAQYGTPDMLMNTIINILTNNAGAYNTNVGYFNANTVSILNVESWKMELKDGVANAVYESDGVTHRQGGFSVTHEDKLPSPNPSSLSAPKPQVRNFALAHTSYDANSDEKNGTFTVLHITYGWNPEHMTFNGNTIECASVMTLDIPVYVSKLLEVQINMKTLDGVQLSESNVAMHGSESGTVVLKTTNTVMAEYVYDYPRTMYDSVCLKKKLTFETSPGNIYLYKHTKLTLIDVTDHDKVYYYYVDKTVANPQIPFENFVDANGNNYKTRDLSDTDNYPKLGTADEPYTDLRGQTWGGHKDDEGFINNYGVGIERFIIIIDKSATEIDATDQTGFTLHSIHARVDDENTDIKLMQRIRYDGKDYKSTPLNTATEEYPNPDWYGVRVNGYTAYNYVSIREIDDASIKIPNGTASAFSGITDEKVGIGAGCGLKASVNYSITASTNYWEEIKKSATDQYLDFVISIQCDNKYVTLPVGTKFSLDGTNWYTIGRGLDYEYGKKQIYYYADRAKKAEENGLSSDSYKEVINNLGRNTNGTINVYFDFRACSENSFADGNYVVRVDAYKTTKREFPVSGDYQDTWISDVYSVYNSSNIGFALQEDDLLYRGINRYLPKVSDNGVIDYKAQLDFRKYLDEETGEIKDVVTNQYYTIGLKIMKKRADGTYVDYTDADNRFKFYYDKSRFVGGETAFGNYDGVVDSDDPLAYGYDSEKGVDCGGVTYKFTAEQLNNGSSIGGVAELAFRLVYDTSNLESEDFSNYKFIAYLYLSENSVSGNEIIDGSSEVLTKEQVKDIADITADPLSDHLIFTLARLKTD